MSTDKRDSPGVLHIIAVDKFIAPFIDFLEEKRPDFDRHQFYCFGNLVRFPIAPRPNVTLASTDRRWDVTYLRLNAAMYRAERIVIHGLWLPLLIVMLLMQPWLLKKCYWVIWGADLYRHKLAERNLRWHINEIARQIVIRRFGHLVTYLEGDIELARQWYGARGEHHECLVYPSNLFANPPDGSRPDSSIHIQIGNSADPDNQHLQMLQDLRPYRNEDIRIFAPLSYSDQNHAVRVEEEGKAIFGDKFVAIREFLPLDEYQEFLGRIDIAIFHSPRQQGMGNIITLLGLGKKVFLKPEVSSWDFFEKKGIKVFAGTEGLLEKMDDNVRQTNIRRVKEYFSEETLLCQLRALFDD